MSMLTVIPSCGSPALNQATAALQGDEDVFADRLLMGCVAQQGLHGRRTAGLNPDP